MEKVIEIHSMQWRSSLATHAATLMNMPVSEVTTADVMACIVAMNDKRDINKKVRQRIGTVMKWAIAQGFRTDDPTGDALTAVLPKSGQRTQLHRALRSRK